MKISINESQSEFVEFEIDGKLYPNAYDYWDGNYLKTYVNLAIPAFKGAFLTNLRAFELSKFLEELDAIGNTTACECVLSNVDETVFVKGMVSYTGAVDWNFTFTYPSGNGAIIKFTIGTGFSIIHKLVDDIKKVLEKWPIIGSPD